MMYNIEDIMHLWKKYEEKYMGIVVIGTSFVDVKGYPEHSYIPNKRHIGNVEFLQGGVARNVVMDIANMTLFPTFLTTVDTSFAGREVLESLEESGVNTEHIIAVLGGLGRWMAIFDEHGEVAVSVAQRPQTYSLLSVLEDAGEEVFASGDSIVFEMDMHKAVIEKIIQLATKYEKKTYAMVSCMEKAIENRAFLKSVDALICNEQEAELLFTESFKEMSNEQMQKVLADKIKLENISLIIATRGKKGAVFADIEGSTGAVLAKEVVVKDTTGAGDAFCAGTVIGLTYGKDIIEALHLGNLLAASVVTSFENVCPKGVLEESGIHIDNLKKGL